jgi:hypothetical protein
MYTLLVAEAPFPPYILRDMNPEVKKVLFSKDEQHLMEDEKDQVGGQPDDAKCKHWVEMPCSMLTCCYPMIDHNLTSNVNSSCIFLRYLQTKTNT